MNALTLPEVAQMKLWIQLPFFVFVLLPGNVISEQDEWATLKLKVVYDGLSTLRRPIPGAPCAIMPIQNERILVGQDGELANLALVMNLKKSEAREIPPSLKSPLRNR